MKIYKGDDFFNVNSRPCPKHNGIIRATLSSPSVKQEKKKRKNI